MESRVNQAVERHKRGYNCAQAVVCTYCDLFDLDENTAYRLSEGFGFGMGTQSVCGVLSGMIMLISLKNSGSIQTPGTTKAATYGITKQAASDFASQAGSALCREIKSPPAKLSCPDCVKAAAIWVEENLI